MLLGLAANLWATSNGILERVKEEVNPSTMNVGLIECTNSNIANVRRNRVEINKMNKCSE